MFFLNLLCLSSFGYSFNPGLSDSRRKSWCVSSGLESGMGRDLLAFSGCVLAVVSTGQSWHQLWRDDATLFSELISAPTVELKPSCLLIIGIFSPDMLIVQLLLQGYIKIFLRLFRTVEFMMMSVDHQTFWNSSLFLLMWGKGTQTDRRKQK